MSDKNQLSHAIVGSPKSSDTVVEQKMDYKPDKISEKQLSDFSEFDSDDDDAMAFGTTVNENDYMHQFKTHNRTQSKADNLGKPNHTVVVSNEHNKMVQFNVDDMDNHTNNGTLTSDTTAQALQQSANYYNDLHDVRRNHSTQISQNKLYDDIDDDNFESRKLEFGQSVFFDKTNEQYFCDVSNNSKRYIFINLHVNRITEIDNVQERFRCKFWIHFSWLPTYEEYVNYKQHLVSHNLDIWKPSWIPVITFPEVIRTWKMQFAEKPATGKFNITFLNGNQSELGYDPSYCKFIRCKLECDMTFSTGFLLVNFPVDCQDLPITMHETSGGCLFIVEKRKRSFASVYTISSVMEEWEFINMIVEIGSLHTGSNESSLAQLKLRLKMRRRFEIYLWNVVFFMMGISALTLCSFSVDSDVDLGERLSIIITLLLTSVAYQSTVFSTLPNVPYLTLLDKYIVISFLFMTLVTIETALLGTEYLNDNKHNRILFIITGCIFIGYHIIFLFYGYNRKIYESRKLYMPSKTMLELYSMSRERMEVEWKSEKLIGNNWKVYTKYPDKIITKTKNGKDAYKRKSAKKLIF